LVSNQTSQKANKKPTPKKITRSRSLSFTFSATRKADIRSIAYYPSARQRHSNKYNPPTRTPCTCTLDMPDSPDDQHSIPVPRNSRFRNPRPQARSRSIDSLRRTFRVSRSPVTELVAVNTHTSRHRPPSNVQKYLAYNKKSFLLRKRSLLDTGHHQTSSNLLPPLLPLGQTIGFDINKMTTDIFSDTDICMTCAKPLKDNNGLVALIPTLLSLTHDTYLLTCPSDLTVTRYAKPKMDMVVISLPRLKIRLPSWHRFLLCSHRPSNQVGHTVKTHRLRPRHNQRHHRLCNPLRRLLILF
jgi:hypothetical protein